MYQDKNWNKKFAFYAVALYRVGNYTDAALIGAIMFEKAVFTELKKFNIDREYIIQNKGKRKGDLQFAIEVMCQKDEKYAIRNNMIDNIRKDIRNKLIHEIEIYEIDREQIWPMLAFSWEILDKESFNKYGGKVGKIDFLTADYAVVDIRESFNKNLQDLLAAKKDFTQIAECDFEELYILRQRLIALGGRLKSELLREKYKEELQIDIISNINTTSAYVWMSMNLLNGERERIKSASASILVTPLDIRIYFDIGGGNHEIREDYYQFLRSKHFENFLTHIDLTEVDFFDNDWYCFIINKVPLQLLKQDDIESQVVKAEEKLAKHDIAKPITWNRLLFGYVIERRDITYSEIVSKLEVIIDLYYCFEEFRQKVLQRESIKFQYNISYKCRPKIEPRRYTL